MDNSVEVRYAGVVVGRGVIVKDLGVGSAFVGVSEPLPVGTLVTLKIGEAVHEARVDDVVESSEPTAVGMRVSWGGAASAPAPHVEPPAVVAPAPASEPVQAVPEPIQAVPEPVQAVPEPVQAAPEPVQAAPEPVQAAPEPVQPVAALEAAPLEPVAAPEDASSAIPAPVSLAGAGADGSQHGGGKKRRKRR